MGKPTLFKIKAQSANLHSLVAAESAMQQTMKKSAIQHNRECWAGSQYRPTFDGLSSRTSLVTK